MAYFDSPIQFVVRKGGGCVDPLHENGPEDYTDEIEKVSRKPRQHKGWHSVKYKGKRYQLFGGIHTPFFINLRMPIKKARYTTL